MLEKAKIIPLNKIPNPSSLSDLRPISILSALSKVFEKISQIQIDHYITNKNLLNEYQSAYRKSHSTATALLNITDDILKELDEGKCTVLCLLDFSKAFDTINHEMLIQKLRCQYHFHDTSCKLIRSYLSNRSQMVMTEDGSSDFQFVVSGVPQGSVLGPVLFSLFINDVPSCIKTCKYHLYADDLQIYSSDKYENINALVQKINNDILSISTWSRTNGLLINANKTQVIMISTSGRPLPNDVHIMVENIQIPYSTVVKDLGLYIDERFSWNYHIDQTCKKINYMLRQLWVTTSFAGISLRQRMFNAYILPHFLFCSNIIYTMNKETFDKLQLVFNSCIRYVFSLRKFDHISHLNNELLGYKLGDFLAVQVLCSIHNILNSGQPKYLAKKLIPLRSSRLNNLQIRKNKTKKYNESFFVRGVGLWNSLPFHFKSSSSSGVLRDRLQLKDK